MTTQIVRLGPEYFPLPTSGRPISGGSIYIGEPDIDPEIPANQIQVYAQQEDGTMVPISQPISTSAGGMPLYNDSLVTLYVSWSYSLKILDSFGTQVYYVPSTEVSAEAASTIVKYIKDIIGLINISSPADDQTYTILSFFDGLDKGGGVFYWDSLVDKATANGGTIIDPANIGGFDGSSSTLAAFLTAQGGGVGFGCWVRIYDNWVNPEWWGAVAQDSYNTTNTLSIQAAFDFADTSTEIKTVIIPEIYPVGVGGVDGSRNFGLILRSGVQVLGTSQYTSGFRSYTNTDMDLLVVDRTSPNVNITIKTLTLDGDSANQTDGLFNLWLYDCTDITIDELYSTDSGSWGIRIEQCSSVQIGTINVRNRADVNADGIHFVDSNTVTVDSIIIYTTGDDGFIIEAKDLDVYDFSIGEIVVSTPVTTAGAGRGVLIFTEVDFAAAQRNIYNINISNIQTHNCKGSAVDIRAGNFWNLDVTINDVGSNNALYLSAGAPGFLGDIKNSRFSINSLASAQRIFIAEQVNGVFKDNYISINGYDPGDGYVGATLIGSGWTGDINIEYDPGLTKVSPQNVVDCYASDSILSMSIKQGVNGLVMFSGASNNTILLGAIDESTSTGITIQSGSNNNKFLGGSVLAGMVNSGTGNKFNMVTGLQNSGTTLVTPDGGGAASIPHGLLGTANYAQLTLEVNSSYTLSLTSRDATNLNVSIFNAGVPVTTGSYYIHWSASL